MAKDDLRGLLSTAFDDLELEAKLKKPGADVVAIAAEQGFQITAEEFTTSLQSWDGWRLSSMHDEEY